MARNRQLLDLDRRLKAIPQAVKDSIAPTLQSAGEELAGVMKSLAPVDDGDLKESITVTPAGQVTPPHAGGGTTTVPELAVAVTAGNSAVRYSYHVEHGTSDTPAQPFFWPAYRLTRKKLVSKIKRSISRAIKDAARTT